MSSSPSIFVTGATGFIGSHLVKRLAEQKSNVRALVRDPQGATWLNELGAEVVKGDITQATPIPEAMQGCQVVYHCAAWVRESGNRQQIWDTNVKGTQNVVEAAVKVGVQRLIHLSTCSVYGKLRALNIEENAPLQYTGDLYADSKIAAEKIVFRAYQEHHLPVVIARASQVYGPGSRQYTIRPVEVIKSGNMVLIDGGRHLCKPIYIDNLIDGLLLCAQSEAAIGQAFNFTDGEPVPWSEFFSAYGQMLGVRSIPSMPYVWVWLLALFYEIEAKLRGKQASITRGAIRFLRVTNSFSNQKARRLLGWEPRVSLEEGMRRTEAWLHNEGYI